MPFCGQPSPFYTAHARLMADAYQCVLLTLSGMAIFVTDTMLKAC